MSILLFDSFSFFLCTKAVQISVCVTTPDMYSCTITPVLACWCGELIAK